jgi:hypothetical protein
MSWARLMITRVHVDHGNHLFIHLKGIKKAHPKNCMFWKWPCPILYFTETPILFLLMHECWFLLVFLPCIYLLAVTFWISLQPCLQVSTLRVKSELDLDRPWKLQKSIAASIYLLQYRVEETILELHNKDEIPTGIKVYDSLYHHFNDP